MLKNSAFAWGGSNAECFEVSCLRTLGFRPFRFRCATCAATHGTSQASESARASERASESARASEQARTRAEASARAAAAERVREESMSAFNDNLRDPKSEEPFLESGSAKSHERPGEESTSCTWTGAAAHNRGQHACLGAADGAAHEPHNLGCAAAPARLRK